MWAEKIVEPLRTISSIAATAMIGRIKIRHSRPQISFHVFSPEALTSMRPVASPTIVRDFNMAKTNSARMIVSQKAMDWGFSGVRKK